MLSGPPSESVVNAAVECCLRPVAELLNKRVFQLNGFIPTQQNTHIGHACESEVHTLKIIHNHALLYTFYRVVSVKYSDIVT